jgi:hypothetical protein
VELLDDLAARLTAPDDEHRSRRERLFVVVFLDVDLKEPGRKAGRVGWSVRALKGTGGEDHRAGTKVAVRGLSTKSPSRVFSSEVTATLS